MVDNMLKIESLVLGMGNGITLASAGGELSVITGFQYWQFALNQHFLV